MSDEPVTRSQQNKNVKKEIISAAAQMLVQSQLDCLAENKRGSGTYGGGWLAGRAKGARFSAKYICQKCDKKALATEIRSWVEYFKNDFKQLAAS